MSLNIYMSSTSSHVLIKAGSAVSISVLLEKFVNGNSDLHIYSES